MVHMRLLDFCDCLLDFGVGLNRIFVFYAGISHKFDIFFRVRVTNGHFTVIDNISLNAVDKLEIEILVFLF